MFFLKANQSQWYSDFLKPVLNEIIQTKPNKLLDIGTGTGLLPRLVAVENKETAIIGIDTNPKMIAFAQSSNTHDLTQFRTVLHTDWALQETFDTITICSVVFLLSPTEQENILFKALSLLNKGGRILLLTPSGNGNFSLYFRYCFWQNYTLFLWKIATYGRAKAWSKQQHLQQLANKYQLHYQKKMVFEGHATLEIITR